MSNHEQAVSRLETHLGRLLVAGVATSAACLAAGMAVWMFAPSSLTADLLFRIGLYVLMATPILRVVVSVVEYARMRDWFFVATTLAVLGVLVTTLFYAFSGR